MTTIGNDFPVHANALGSIFKERRYARPKAHPVGLTPIIRFLLPTLAVITGTAVSCVGPRFYRISVARDRTGIRSAAPSDSHDCPRTRLFAHHQFACSLGPAKAETGFRQDRKTDTQVFLRRRHAGHHAGGDDCHNGEIRDRHLNGSFALRLLFG